MYACSTITALFHVLDTLLIAHSHVKAAAVLVRDAKCIAFSLNKIVQFIRGQSRQCVRGLTSAPPSM